MSNWSLKLSNNTEITIDEKGNLSQGPPVTFFAENEKEAIKEARKRIKKMRYFIIGEDSPKVINFNMFYKRFQIPSFFKLGYKMILYSIYMLFDCMLGNTRGKR